MHGLPKLGFEAEIIPGFGRKQWTPHHNYLGDVVGLGFQQHRVHLYPGLNPGSVGLDRLGTPDLSAVSRHIGVVRHVLGLERSDPKTVLAEDAAERRYHHALPHVGGGALDH